MLDFNDFANCFPLEGPNPYDQNGVRSIETFRKGFDGVLFIDRVLRALGIGQGKTYPPRGETGVRSLHKQIMESNVTLFHKLSVLYYLLLDFDYTRGGHSHLAQALADEASLPQKYQILMRGLWHMDHKEFKFALEHLAHPSLPSEFADEIIIALVRHADADARDYSLPLAYYHATQPIFKTGEAFELFFGALAQTSITEALAFLRTFPQHTQQQLFEQLLASVTADPRSASTRGKELASLSLTDIEEKWFHEYLASGDGRKSKNAKIILQVRQIVTGRDRKSTSYESLIPVASRTGKTGR
ncbi:protein ELYS [Naviculisporaceae sp. PSN 640]